MTAAEYATALAAVVATKPVAAVDGDGTTLAQVMDDGSCEIVLFTMSPDQIKLMVPWIQTNWP